MTTVLFWDIDGTLLTTAKAGILALEKAASDLAGAKVTLSALKTAGGIDGDIAANVLKTCGLTPSAVLIEQLLQRYINYLPATLSLRQGAVLQGVREILDCLQERPDVISLLLTGNIEASARVKLLHYGLDTYFSEGAFADRALSRDAIARQALALVQQRLELRQERLYVIGDTPHDICCSQAIGARAIAVATGSYRVEELQQHEPWMALAHLPSPTEFLALVGLNDSPV